MPVLTEPPPTKTEIQLPSVSFFGRSLEEYAQFFALDIDSLRGRPVLDVAAGPSSFTAEACRRGIDAVAVDPLYGSTIDALRTHVQLDYGKMFAQMRAKPRLFRLRRANERGERSSPLATRRSSTRAPTYFSSIDEAETERRAAAQRFLSDYEAHFAHGRYVGGALPRLPFLDGAFDLVLCAHLLFTYSRHFDFDWHLAACRELVRVSAGEVRLHPVCGTDGQPYAELGKLRRELLARGITSELVPVAYEFFVGGDSMLVLNPQGPARTSS
jgi:hypothetical protein